MKLCSILFFISAIIIFTGCSEDGNDTPVLLPSNLVVNVVKSETVPGKVFLFITAENANYFTVTFGENPGETPVKSTDGTEDYTYTSSGDFNIVVKAHATATDYVEKETSVEINLLTDVGGVTIPATGFVSPTSYAGLNLVWQDEFSGTALNAEYWTHEIGRGSNGWGNNELQYYRSENTQVKDGYLIITAKKENFADAQYTSSRIITKDKKSFKYGRIDIRAALPKGQGMWPALWMLGSNISTVGWPKSGEIDIMEMVGGGGREKTIFGTLHWDNAGSNACTCGQGNYSLPSGTFNDKFHVFSIVWNATSITWYIDNVQFHVINTSPENLSEFRESFFFIFNIAVGGNLPGNPDGTTVFPQHMIVDYVRVFQ